MRRLRLAGEAVARLRRETHTMTNQLLTYGSRTFEVICETESDEKKLRKLIGGTLAIGGLFAVETTEGTFHLGVPTGVEIILTAKR